MEFPGLLGIGLYRLRVALRRSPIATLGPLFGVIAADMSVDIRGGRYSSVLIELVIAPLLALTISVVAQRGSAGPSGFLFFVLGTVSAVGASILLTRGLAVGSASVFMIGLRHLTVGIYAWAAIASEPPPRRELRFAHVAG